MNFKVKEICKVKGITITQLAERLKIKQESLSRAINGNPTIETLERIADALSVPVTELFEQPATDIITCPKCRTKFKMEQPEHTNCDDRLE